MEQTLDVTMPEMVKQLVEVPKIISQDRIQQRTVKQIVGIPVPQVVEEVVEVCKVSSQDRVQQRFGRQIIETPSISLAEKIVEMPVTQTREETQQVANTHVQHIINTVRVEILKIIKKTVEGPQLQIVEKTAKTPETQTIQGTRTFESMGTATARQVVEIEASLPAESASPIFDTAPVLEVPPVSVEHIQPVPATEYMAPARTITDAHANPIVEYVAPAPTVAHRVLPATYTVQEASFPTATVLEVKSRTRSSDHDTGRTAGSYEDIKEYSPIANRPKAQVCSPVVQRLKSKCEAKQKGPQYPQSAPERAQVPTIQSVQKTVEVPRVQYIDKVVDIPVEAAGQDTQHENKKRKTLFVNVASGGEAEDGSENESALTRCPVQGGEYMLMDAQNTRWSRRCTQNASKN